MALWDWLRGGGRRKAASVSGSSRPKEMVLYWMGPGQVMWYEADSDNFLKQGYLGNHVVFSVVDWVGSKLAVAPPILYEVKDEKQLRRYKSLLKDPTPDSVMRALDIRGKAMEEVDKAPMLDLFTRPNPIMSWTEFVYGYYVYKSICGSAYVGGVRDGQDGTMGKIREMWLFPSHLTEIVAGDVYNPIKGYKLRSAPDKMIDAENVMQLRNFSPRYDTPTQWLYGLSKLHALRSIVQEYNEGTEVKVDAYQSRGARDIIFPKSSEYSEESVEQAKAVQEAINRKIQQSGAGGIIANSVELGSIRVGLSPIELGILESQAVTKKDICSAFHVPSIIMGYNDQGTTYNNLSEARKIALTDAVIPELEALKDGLNNWLIPSWFPTKAGQNQRYLIDFDYESYPELQKDVKDTVDWMNKAGCLTVNERRALLRYDSIQQEEGDRVLVPTNVQFLEDVGIGSLDETDPNEMPGYGESEETTKE